MAENNVMAPQDLESAAPTPIAQLENGLDDQKSRVVDGVVTITWPYSIVTKSIAFVLAEKDYLLRRNKGQVRVEFHGAAGKALKDSAIGGGDEVRISLDGVQWEPCSTATRLPGTPLDTQLKFTNRLLLRFRRAETEETSVITVDQPADQDEDEEEQAPEPAPPVSSPLLDLSGVFATPRPASPPLRAKRPAAAALEADEYASPAYLKRARVSYGSLFEGGLDIFDDDVSKKRKSRRKSRFSMGATGWRYSSKSPSPEPEPTGKEDELEASESEEEIPIPPVSIPKSSMVDEGSQTQAVPEESFASLSASQSAFLPNTPTPATNPFQTQHMAEDRGFGFGVDAPTSTFGTAKNLFASQAPLPQLDVDAASATVGTSDPMTDSAIDQLLGLEPGSTDASKALPVSEGGFGSSLFGSAPTHGFGWGVPPPTTTFPTTTAEPQQSVLVIDSSPVLEVAADDDRSKFADAPMADHDAEGDEDADADQVASEHDSIDSTAIIIPKDYPADARMEQEGSEAGDESQDEVRADDEVDEDDQEEEEEEEEEEDDATEYEIRERVRQQRLRDGESEDEEVDDQSDDGHYDDEEEEEEEDDEEQSRSYSRRREHSQDDDDVDEEEDEEEDEGEYDDDEEEQSPSPPPKPKEPVFIDLLSDSDDDEPVKPTPLPASAAPKVEPKEVATEVMDGPEEEEEAVEEDEEEEADGGDEGADEKEEADEDEEEEIEVTEAARLSDDVSEAHDEDAEGEDLDDPSDSPKPQISPAEEDVESEPEAVEDVDAEMESEADVPMEQEPEAEAEEPEPAAPEPAALELVESDSAAVESVQADANEEPIEEEEELVQIVEPESMDVDEAEPTAEEDQPLPTTEPMDEDPAEDPAEPEKPAEDDAKPTEAEEPVVEPEELEAVVEHLKPEEQAEVVEVLTSKRITRSAAALSPPPTQVQLADDGHIHPVEEPNQDEQIAVEEVIEHQMVTRSSAVISPPPAQVQLADDGVIEAVEEAVQIIPEEATEEETAKVKPAEDEEQDKENEVTAEDQIMEEFLQHSAEQSFLSSSDAHPDDAERKVDANTSTRSLRSHRRTRSAQSEQPSIDAVLAEAAESSKTASKRARKAPTPVPAPADPAPRFTRSRTGRADPSVALAKAGISSSPSSQEATPRRRLHRTRTMLDIAGAGREHILDSPYSPRTTRSHDSPASTPAQGTPEPASTSQIHETEPVEPVIAEAEAVPEVDEPADEEHADNKTESGSALRFKLRKSLSTMLPDNFPLDSLRHSLNKVGDIMAVAAAKPEPSHRPRNGPRDYMLELFLTDPSSPSSSVHVAQLYRPHQSALPIVEEGDVVLLRRMQVHAVKGRGFGVRVTDSSAWAVFEQNNDEMLPQIRGPPVEVTDKETEYAESLQRWWKGLDKRARTNLAKASKKASSAGKG